MRCACRGDPPPLPLSSWFTVQGYRDRWKRFIGGAKSMYTLAKCRKYVPGFSLPGFKADVLRIYEDACSGIARGDRTLLRQVSLLCKEYNLSWRMPAMLFILCPTTIRSSRTDTLTLCHPSQRGKVEAKKVGGVQSP